MSENNNLSVEEILREAQEVLDGIGRKSEKAKAEIKSVEQPLEPVEEVKTFTPKNENWQVDNLEDAVNDLYERKNIKSGEAFLLTAGFSGINGVHGYEMYGTEIYIKDLDFKNIKNFN